MGCFLDMSEGVSACHMNELELHISKIVFFIMRIKYEKPNHSTARNLSSERSTGDRVILGSLSHSRFAINNDITVSL